MFHCSSTHYRLRVGIGYFEFGLKIQCVLPAFSTRFQCELDKYKNAGGRCIFTLCISRGQTSSLSNEDSCLIKIHLKEV